MRVSIIIPLYNQAQYVATAIRSALCQTYGDREVIVVNDGSTQPETEGVLRSFGCAIGVVTQRNQGLAAARNAGVSVATGDAILPLDADDWIDSTYLDKTVPHLEDPEVGVVATDMQYEGLANNIIRPHGTSLEAEKWDNGLPVCSLIRRTAFPGYVHIEGGFEDWNLWIDILKRGWKVAVVSEPLFHYRLKPESMVVQASRRRAELIQKIRALHPDVYR